MLGHTGKQLKLSHGKPEGRVGRAGRATHGSPQPGDDVGHFRPDLLLAYEVLHQVALSDVHRRIRLPELLSLPLRAAGQRDRDRDRDRRYDSKQDERGPRLRGLSVPVPGLVRVT